MLSAQEKVSIVSELRQEWPLSRLLIAAGLPRSTFYYHVKRLAAPDRYQSARALVLKIYHQHKGRYGYRRIRLACRNEGVLLNGKTVRKLMKELGISSLIRVKKYRSYKGEQVSWSTLNEPGNIPGMNSSPPDDIDELKRLLAEQEALNRALLEKLNEREREIDHLQAQPDKLRRMNFSSRSEKVSRRIAQMEADLNQLQKESKFLT